MAKKKKKTNGYSEKVRATVLSAIARGDTAADLSSRYGMSVNTIHNWVVKARNADRKPTEKRDRSSTTAHASVPVILVDQPSAHVAREDYALDLMKEIVRIRSRVATVAKRHALETDADELVFIDHALKNLQERVYTLPA